VKIKYLNNLEAKDVQHPDGEIINNSLCELPYFHGVIDSRDNPREQPAVEGLADGVPCGLGLWH